MKVNALRLIEMMEQEADPALVQALKALVADGRVLVRLEQIVDESTGELRTQLVYQAASPELRLLGKETPECRR